MSGQQIANSKYRNWVKAGLGLKYVKEGLEPFCDDIVKQQHTDIIHKVKQTHNLTTVNCGFCNLRTLQPDHVRTKNKQCPLGQKDCNCQYPGSKVSCPNNVCGAIYSEIINLHASTPPAPFWRNTDVQRWCTDPWAVAKCFINAPGYTQKLTVSQIDCCGLLHLLINSKDLQKHIHCKITGHDVFSKVRQHRNVIFHSDTMEVEDTDVTDYIDDMIAVLRDSKELNLRTDSQAAVQKLLQLKQHDFIITTSLAAEVKAAKLSIKKLQKDIEQKGFETEREIEQSGSNIKAEVEQSGSTVKAQIEQSGSNIKAEVEQSGSTIKAEVEQSGSTIKAQVEQSGSAIKAEVEQSGLAIKAEVEQSGSAIKAEIEKKCLDIKADVEKKGIANIRAIKRKGSDMTKDVKQTGCDIEKKVKKVADQKVTELKQAGLDVKTDLVQIGLDTRKEVEQTRSRIIKEIKETGADMQKEIKDCTESDQQRRYFERKKGLQDVTLNKGTKGPAVTLTVQQQDGPNISIDITPKLTLPLRKLKVIDFNWPRHKTWDWLSEEKIDEVTHTEVYLVPKGDKYWKVSFANWETTLLIDIDFNGTWRKACLRIMKKKLAQWKSKSDTGLKGLSSYMLKTTLLWLCEILPYDDFWTKSELANRYLNFLQELEFRLRIRKIGEYFNPSVNLLENKDVDEVEELREFVLEEIRFLDQ